MEDRMAGRYWCHMCSQMVNPMLEPEIKCPFCESGFVEEMTSIRHNSNTNGIDSGSVNTLSLWAPILLGLIGGLGSSQFRIIGREQTSDSNSQDALDDELGREFESLLRRRRRTSASASALRMLQDMRAVAASESENSENGRDRSGRMILFDPFNDEALIVQGSFGFNQGQNSSHRAASSFGDYLMGTGWDRLLQYLAENDPNRYGTPPAQKEAVEAMPTVTVEDSVQCSVCLEDIEIGSEAKEMPCKHKFHARCISPWLELHSSCPVCRYQLPSDDSKIEANVTRNSEGRVGSNDAQSSSRVGTGRRYWIPIPWPYDGLLTSPGPQSDSISAPSSEAMPGSANAAQTDTDDN
ncbi:E3 ubiquitin-protein ligase SIRP1-like [Durio zibethinus]|uniref:RING-type E3 ubiquitin transferase n=1 Tax=Durio zibethinus TaxID=66656 RepID=A0A6P5Z284_DURZI|nr:E3 ubiquitin-protein ligase SIRP1-like [Durio zibethinus]XP_022746859.1 E3 ubiquitin-protein ligase SIRP1-like [Durio zibethinus]